MTAKISTLRKTFSQESLDLVVESAKRHEVAGCVCPNCGSSMSLIKVASGKRQIEIDVCGKCQTVWYDKDEFEELVPNDGVLKKTTVSAGKAFRREIVVTISSDLRAGRCKVADIGGLKTVLKGVYHVLNSDIVPIIGALQSQKIIKASKTGKIAVLPMAKVEGKK